MNCNRLFLFTLLFFFLCPAAFAQIADNFSDGNLTQNPAWQGDLDSFKINNGELQLGAAVAGASRISVQGNVPDSAVWNLRFRLEFAPSNNNLLRIYLLTDQADLSAANGYFLEIGETGSLDALRFYRQDAGAKTLLATGQPGLVAANPDITLRIKRTVTGTWEAEAAAGSGAFQPQFSATDATYTGGLNRFFGFQCVYTTLNIAKFFFDDLFIAPDVPDTQPPVLLSANAANETSVVVSFDETLDSISAVNPANYTINNGVGIPLAGVLQADKRTVHLLLGSSLSTGNYFLQTSDVKDVSGNPAPAQTAGFQFIKIDAATEFDVLINEVMADPVPGAGLPELEWLELYNRSGKTFELSSLRIQDATGSPVALPAHVFAPGAYVILTAIANAAALQAAVNGTVLGTQIGSTTLNNDGDIMTISDLSGNIIDRVAYGIDWHTELSKADGGWSLERINPGLPCLESENWKSCPTLPGGTPGMQNASFQNLPDNNAPRLLAAYPESPVSVLLTFSEGLDKTAAEISAEYIISPPRTVALASLLPNRSFVRLTLSEPLEVSTLYGLTVRPSITDCSGNAVPATDTAFLGLTEKPEPQDIVVNEVMFNPATGNGRYVEFYNRSDKIFNWSEFFIADFSSGADVAAISHDRLFLPGQYDVFTEFPNNIRNTFSNILPENVLENDLPSLSDNDGNVTLYWAKNGTTVVVDSFNYTRDWHNALYSNSDREGVALERIHPAGPTNVASNWTSASSIVTGMPGTPTLPNSQNIAAIPPGNDWISFPIERLSPDDDGFEDFLTIQYNFPQSGFFATMSIFDSEGIPVKRLVRQELIGTEGALRWDGDLDDGTRAKPGIYIVFLELFAPDGTTERVKRAVAVVGRF